jgi:hypothetical protein
VRVALVTPPSVLGVVWISLNVDDMSEYLCDVTVGTVLLRDTQDQQLRLPRGVAPLICEFFSSPIGSWTSPLFSLKKMSCKTVYEHCSLRDRQSELMIFVSGTTYRPTSLPLVISRLHWWRRRSTSRTSERCCGTDCCAVALVSLQSLALDEFR